MNKKELTRFEFNIGAYIFQVLGIGILLLGIGFLLKYSIDQGWLVPKVSIFLGLALGTCLLLLPELWSKRFHVWAQACTAGGIGLYYLSTYAAHNLYQLISAPIAFGAFIGIAVLATAMSLRYNSVVIAALSLLGACITPLMVNSYSAPTLAVYLVVVAGTFSVLAAVKRWHWLPLISLGFLSYYFCVLLQFQLTGMSLSVFLIAFFYIYNLPYYYGLFRPYISNIWEMLTVFAAGAFSVYAWHRTAVLKFFDVPSKTVFISVAVIAGVFYAMYAGWLYKKNRFNISLFAVLFTLMTGSFFAAAITQWQGLEQSIVLYLLGLFIFICSVRVQEPLMRLGSYVLWLYSSLHMLRLLPTLQAPGSYIFNTINAAVAGGVLVYICAVYFVQFIKRFDYFEKSWLQDTLVGGAIVTIFYWFHTPVWPTPYHIIGLILYASLLFMLSISIRYKLIRQFAYWCAACAIVYFVIHYAFVNVLHPYYFIRLNLMFVAFMAAFIATYVCAYFHMHILTTYEQKVLPKLLRLGLACFVYAWLRANIIIWLDPVQQPGLILARIWGDYDSTTMLARTHFTNVVLTIYYTLYAIIVIGIGLKLKDKWLRFLGLTLVFIVLGKLASMIMIMPNTSHRILAFILVGLLLITGSFAYQKLSNGKEE